MAVPVRDLDAVRNKPISSLGRLEVNRLLENEFLHAAEILRAKFSFRRVECNNPDFRVHEIFSESTDFSGRSVRGKPLIYHQVSQSSLSLYYL